MNIEPISGLHAVLLLALVLVWALLLFGGFLTGRPNAAQTHRIPTAARIGSSLALVIFAWLWFLMAQNQQSAGIADFAFFAALGMSFGFLGDIFMARLLPIQEHVLGGIGAFGLGHLAYISGLWRLGDAISANDFTARWIALAACLALGAILWYVVVWRGGARSFLHQAALPYALLLSATLGIASGLAPLSIIFVAIALGALLFLLSDLLLAAQLFNGLHFRLIGDVIWLLYGPGQMLIVTSIGLASILGS